MEGTEETRLINERIILLQTEELCRVVYVRVVYNTRMTCTPPAMQKQMNPDEARDQKHHVTATLDWDVLSQTDI